MTMVKWWNVNTVKGFGDLLPYPIDIIDFYILKIDNNIRL